MSCCAADATTLCDPALSVDGLYESVATPLALVVALPTLLPSTVKPTDAPATAAPPVVRVSVALSETGPAEPKVALAGEGAACANDVAMDPVTTSVPVVVGSEPPV